MENSHYKKLKFFTFLFLLSFLILNLNFVSSANWDNRYVYDNQTKTALIENAWGLPIIGKDLAILTLTSEERVRVPRGVDRLVGTFNFTAFDDFNFIFEDLFLTNLRNGNAISRGQQFKYKKYKTISVDDYQTVCQNYTSVNGTTAQNCTQEEIGNHLEEVFDWIPITNPTNNFSKDVTYEIGVFVDVEKGDWGDWIPKLMGVEIVEWATWTESLNVDLQAYYKLDETSGDAIDSTPNQYNGTVSDTTRGITGIINNSYFFNGINSSVAYGKPPGLVFKDAFTINLWVNWTENGSDNGIIGRFDSASTKSYTLAMDDAGVEKGEPFLVLSSDGSANSFSDRFGVAVLESQWAMVTATYSKADSNVSFYINGTHIGGGSLSVDLFNGTSSFIIGNFYNASANSHRGGLDEIGLWNRSLSPAEVEQLYNNGTGITYIGTFGPSVTILYPQNITYGSSVTQLNYSVDAGADKCWSSTDQGATNSSPVSAGTNFTLASVGGQNIWRVYCNDTEGTNSDTVYFFINKTVITNLLSPANDSNSTITITNFSVNSTPLNTNLTNVTLYIWYDNGTLILTNTTLLSGTASVQTNFTQNLSQGNLIWNAETCGEDVACNFDTNRTLEIHTTPSTVIIHYPNETITYLTPGGNLTLNWSILEAGQNLSEHITNCSYIYNGTETFLNLTQCIEINETSFLYLDGINNLTFKAVEEFGLITTNETSWDFLFEKYNVTFDNQTFEGTQETFTAEVILGGGASLTQAILYYNDTNYSTSVVFTGGEYTITSSITIPLIDQDTNFSLGFFLVVGGTTYDLETFNQTALSINLSACGPSNDTVINMSLYNEETKASILGNIEVNAQTISKTSNEVTSSTNISFTNVSSGRICLSPVEAYTFLYFSSEIRYSATDFVPEFYYIQLADMDDYPRNLSLFDLASNDSTEFLVKYQDDNLITVEGAIVQLQRKYISENAYEVVEAPLTSDEGTAVVHIDLNTIKYRVSVVKDGVLLDFFDNVVFDCENELSGECTKLLLGKLDPQNDIPLTNLTDFSYSISSVNNTITTAFVVPSGTPSNVNVVLTQLDQFGNETTCNQSVISSAGTIDCTFNDTIGESYLSLSISKDGEPKAQQTYIVVDDSDLDFLGNNFFIVVIILLSLVGMAFASPEWMIINAVITLLIGGAFWLLNGVDFVMGLGSLMWLVISTIILIIKLSKQEDR